MSVWSVTVSYTHLDVYKRQTWFCGFILFPPFYGVNSNIFNTFFSSILFTISNLYVNDLSLLYRHYFSFFFSLFCNS